MKKIFAFALCALTLAAAILPVSAQASNINSANGNGDTTVVLDLDAPHFDVTGSNWSPHLRGPRGRYNYC